RILIVDDDESSRRSLSLILGKNGYEVETAGTGREALEKAQQRFFNLAFLEIRLPDVEGTKLIAPLKEIHPCLAVIMITGYATVETAVQALTNGASAYVTKPLDNMDEVLATLGGLLEKQRLIEEKERAEEALRVQNELLKHTLDSLNHPFYVIDANDYTVKMANSAAQAGDLTENTTCYALTHHSDKPCKSVEHGCPLKEVKKSKKPAVVEHIHYDKDGNARNVEVHCYPIFNTEGNVIQALEYSLDITERKQAEEALRESEDKYRKLFELGSDALFLIEVETGRILDLNDTALKMYGYSREEALQMKNTNFSAEPAQTRQATVEHEQQIPVRYHKKKDETIFPTDISVAYYTWHGREVCIAAIRDITERKRAEEALRETEEKIRNLFDSIADGIGAIDLNGVYTEVNQGLLKIYGCSSTDEVLGKSYFTFVAPHDIEGIIAEMQKTIEAESITHVEYTGLRADGSEFPAEAVGAMVKESSGNVSGFIGVIRDITERKRAEEELRESEEKYRALFDSALDGVAIIDAETMKIVLVNQTALKMYGFDSAEDMAELNMLDYIHPDDRERGLRIMVEDMFEKDLRRVNEFRTITKDGQEMWLSAVGTKIEYQGKPAGLVSFMDITERKRAEEELIRLSNAVRMANDSIVISDLEVKIIEVNEATLKMYGTDDEGDLVGKNAYDLFAPEDRDKAIASTKEVLERGYVENREYHIITKDGSTVLVAMNVAIMKDVDGKPTGFVAVSRDITERKRMEEKLIELSITDDLTGLYNRRHFYTVLETELNRTWRDGSSFSLVMLDLDGFKKYNDRFGHASGDAALKTFANALTSTLRKADTAFRYGGDEFTIVLPATKADRARKIIERVRSKWLQMLESQFTNLETPLGFSAGIAQFPEDAETADSLVFLADTSLYFAKREGGSRPILVSDIRTPSADTMSVATWDNVYTLASAVDARDPHTYGHSEAIAAVSEMIGKAIGLSEKEIADLWAASLLHDIGKVDVPISILAKRTALTEDEWRIIRKHPTEGVKIVGTAKEMEALIPMIRHHHEWYDGTGYPDGLKGEEIPLGARIISVADAYISMTTQYSYREAISKEEAMVELRRCSGTQFDPELVEAFC
ncbi:MAG: PAS domain S-box protein, partial [Dehalococcoidia bacterium]|nr:PAS domain S-box protein [Dehalococcoidia bacterium]